MGGGGCQGAFPAFCRSLIVWPGRNVQRMHATQRSNSGVCQLAVVATKHFAGNCQLAFGYVLRTVMGKGNTFSTEYKIKLRY